MTRAEARRLAQRFADMENASFVSTAEWNSYLDLAHADLYDLMISVYEDYFFKDPSPTYTITGSTITLPSDFYKLRGIDLSLGGNNYATVHPYMFEERNVLNRQVSRVAWGRERIRYRILGTKINFIPAEQAAGTYVVHYIPRYTPLTADSEEYTGFNDFEEYIPTQAACMALDKEESDSSMMNMRLQKIVERIKSVAPNRDSGEPQRISDTQSATFIEDLLLPY